jgi:hypothetical protein
MYSELMVVAVVCANDGIAERWYVGDREEGSKRDGDRSGLEKEKLAKKGTRTLTAVDACSFGLRGHALP